MGKLYAEIDETLRTFIEAQHVFFVATAPTETSGHVNCSPKGRDSLRVLDGNSVAYLDYVGSGVETIAHLRQNGRIVLMFCAFEGRPKIVRLHGRGFVVLPADPGFDELLAAFGRKMELGMRAIVRIDVTRISDSCGFGVPLYRHVKQRDQLARWAERKGEAGLETYKLEKNSASIDGLPGLDPPMPDAAARGSIR
jgi:hypothetical protein